MDEAVWKRHGFAAFYGDAAEMLYLCVPFWRENKAALRTYKSAKLVVGDNRLEIRFSKSDDYDDKRVFKLRSRPSVGSKAQRYWLETKALAPELLRTFDLLKYRYRIEHVSRPWWQFFLGDKVVVNFDMKTPKRGRVKWENLAVV